MNVDDIEAIVGVLADSKLAELEVRQGDQTLRLRRSPKAPAAAASVVSITTPAAPTAVEEAAADEPTPSGKVVVTAALVGIFHQAGQPLQKGETVPERHVLGQIEAMRLNNACVAPQAGTITGVFVEEGQPVEYGQPLFEIEAAK